MNRADALEAFRRERGLLSGDDLLAWLERAGLDEDEWAARVAAGDTAGLPHRFDEPAGDPAAASRRPVPVPGAMPPQVFMHGRGSCGHAALAVVCRVLGAETPSHPDVARHSDLASIVAAARALGLPAAAVKASRSRIGALAVPWIAHVDGGHWIVVHRVAPEHVVVSDPARGAGRLRRDAFELRWSGWAAVFAAPVHCE